MGQAAFYTRFVEINSEQPKFTTLVDTYFANYFIEIIE